MTQLRLETKNCADVKTRDIRIAANMAKNHGSIIVPKPGDESTAFRLAEEAEAKTGIILTVRQSWTFPGLHILEY